jgi:chromosome segregation ATPase
MSFTDKDRQALIELINNIQHSFFSDGLFDGGDSTKLAMPCRLVRSAAELLEQSYQPGIMNRLDESEVRLLLTYLSKAIESVSSSLGKVVSSLPEKTPDAMRTRLESGAGSLEAIRAEYESLFAAAGSLLGREDEILGEKRKLEELRERHRLLLEAQEQLRVVDLDALRAEVDRLEAEVGTPRAELERLRREFDERKRESETVGGALSDTRRGLGALDQGSRDLAAGLKSLFDEMLAVLEPYLVRCEKGVQRAAEVVAEKTAEGRQLEEQLRARMAEVNKACEEVAQLAAAVKLYAEADRQVARSVPTVVNVTRERLILIEEQLQEIDAELKLALERHQSARHVADRSGVGA